MTDSLYPAMVNRKDYDALQARLDEALGRVSQLSRQLTAQKEDFIQAVHDFPEGCDEEKKNFLKFAELLEVSHYTYSVTLEYNTDEEITEEDAEEIANMLGEHLYYEIRDVSLDTEDGATVDLSMAHDVDVRTDFV